MILEQASRALQPSAGHRLFTPKCQMVPRKPHGDSRGRDTIVLFTVNTIGTLARIEHDICRVEPPCRKAKTLQRLRRFVNRQYRQKGVSCRWPVAGCKCSSARRKVRGNLCGIHFREMVPASRTRGKINHR